MKYLYMVFTLNKLIMKNVIKTLVQILKALPIVIELLEMFASKSKDTDTSVSSKSDKDIIDNV